MIRLDMMHLFEPEFPKMKKSGTPPLSAFVNTIRKMEYCRASKFKSVNATF